MREFSRRGKTYRTSYLDATNGLYGEEPVKPQYKPKAKRKKDPYETTEFQIQSNLVQWARLQGLPLISIPNAGKRSYWQGEKEVRMGLTKGFDDMALG